MLMLKLGRHWQYLMTADRPGQLPSRKPPLAPRPTNQHHPKPQRQLTCLRNQALCPSQCIDEAILVHL